MSGPAPSPVPSPAADGGAVPQGSRPPIVADVVIVGAGLGGTAAASVLARAGHRVALVDTHAVYPAEFRAEKLGAPHTALLGRLGLAEAALGAATAIDGIDVYRFGRRVARHADREYGFAYSDLVNALRGALPPSVAFLVGRVNDIATSADGQSVVLGDGRRVEGRLLVVATGLGDAIRRKVGVGRTELRKAHSLSLGFSLDRPAADYPFASLAYYGLRREDRVAYLTLFPIGDAMRANLFVYRDANEAWTRAFRTDPREALLALMPGLERACHGVGIAGRVQVRPIALTTSDAYRRDGVVLVGDAFCTTCPAPGVGIQRVLTDVERLCAVHVPRWLATPGMEADKIAAFYDDPIKRASDAKGLGLSEFSRSMAVDPGLIWSLRRFRNDAARRGAAWLRDATPALLSRIDRRLGHGYSMRS